MEKGKRKSMEIPESICRVLERVKSVFREKPEVCEIFENCYTDTLRTAVKHLEEEEKAAFDMPRGKEQAFRYHDKVMVAMNELRRPADELEKLVDKTYWPFPTYADLLFEV